MIWTLVAIVAVVAFAGAWAWRQYFQTYHLRTVQPNVLYRDGLRSMREFNTAINTIQPKAVVSLLDRSEREKEPFSLEADFLRRSRIRAVNIAIPLGGWPTTAQVQSFLKTVEDPRRQPVLVHCAQGVRRTGMMVAAYQLSVLKWDKDRAKNQLETFGHSERTVGDIKRFIDVYDPVKREVTQTLAPSSE